MITNSPFLAHGINHLSASQVNSWVSDPAGYLAALAGMKSQWGPAAWRGTASEHGMWKAITKHTTGITEALHKFDEEVLDNSPIYAPSTVEKQRSDVPLYVEHGANFYRTLGELEYYQTKVVVEFEELEIPFVGYVDFIFKDSIRDCKTAARKPSQMTESARRQLAIYALAYPDHEVWVDYVTPREVVSYKHTDIKKYQNQVLQIALGLRKFLAISDDPKELCSMFYPDTDDWRWNADMVAQANKIWSHS